MPRKKRPSPKLIAWSKEDFKVVAWCHKNDIKMCSVPYGKGYRVEIIIRGKSNFSPDFTKDEVYTKQKDYYYYYYDKYNKDKV